MLVFRSSHFIFVLVGVVIGVGVGSCGDGRGGGGRCTGDVSITLSRIRMICDVIHSVAHEEVDQSISQ